MKKIPSILLIGFLFVLSACATPAGAATAIAPSPTPSVFSTNYADAMPVASQLALGTLRLKGTADDLTTDEATNLLMLWKGLVAVSSATNPSEFEINGVIGQIQQTMTPTQVQAIASMKLTNADITTTVQAMGLTFGGAGRFGGGGAGANGAGATTGGTTGANRAGGNGGNFARGGGGGGGGAFFFGGGGGPGGGFGGIPSSGQTANNTTNNSAASAGSTQATVQARATQRAFVGNTFLYSMVVNYLETIVPGAAPVRATPTPAQ